MRELTTLFWDIGGVILTNGWDRASRREAAELFHMDWEDFQDRHDLSFPAFETGAITLDQYLDRTVFCRPQRFTREEFTAFMFAQSREYPETRAILANVAKSGRYLLAAINNEPRELNEYRIEAFQLRRDFSLFFSSCYVGLRKPDGALYRLALEVTQRRAEQCLLIDDRPLNLENPHELGMQTVHYQNPAQLRAELERHGISVSTA
ncbi:MAG TPA: HAD-IA family hydrolase [Candidatus Acidoferrales bacterium]